MVLGKLLTYHIARHTFATTVTLANGVPIESVSKMLGQVRKMARTTHEERSVSTLKFELR
jgi:site-specific recombinase XerD